MRGSGYIATLVAGSERIVDDFRVRDGATDAKLGNPGNFGAANGGLGAFEVQYARGTAGATVGGRPARDRQGNEVTNVVDPVTGALFPLSGTGSRPTWGFLSGRLCFDSEGEGVYDVTLYRPASAPGATQSVDYQMDVWIRERAGVETGFGPLPGSQSRFPGDTHALLQVSYYYRFYPNEVDSAIVVRTFRRDQVGVPLVKEPKVTAAVRADGRFTEIDVLRPNRTIAKEVTRGQPERPDASLNTRHSDDASRVVARWGGPDNSSPCAVPCFSVSMRSVVLPRTLDARANPFTAVRDPFVHYSRQPWENSGTNAHGLDGWAVRSAGRGKAYPRDTTSDNEVTSCSADYPRDVFNANGKLIHRKGDFIYLKPYFHHSPPFTDKERSRVSSLANVSMPDVRRWEIGGWKPGAVGGGDRPDQAYVGSFVMFHGWEGAHGPGDCEPLAVAMGPGVETYGMVTRYTVGGPFALHNSQPIK